MQQDISQSESRKEAYLDHFVIIAR